MAVAGSLTYDTKIDNNGFEKGLKKLGSVGSTALKGITTAMATTIAGVSTAITGLSIASVNSYADLEQNVGGVETLFKNSADKVIKNAENAYKTAGMSANQYMSTVTSFSASLLQSLGGDTEKAADVADMALIDMADNANKMGTSMEDIQNAYQGFAKQNYTMLDNLKLGYGGTKTEMERLLKDAQKITGIEYNIDNLSDVYNAIHVIQGELGITGTTAQEAASTISGSVSSMKAAWDNFLNGSGTLDSFIETVITSFKNIMGAVEKLIPDIITSIVNAIPQIVSAINEIFPQIMSLLLNQLPVLIEQLGIILNAILQVLVSYAPQLIPIILQTIMMIVDVIIQNLPLLISAAVQIIVALCQGLAQSLPQLIPEIINAIILIVETLLNNIDQLIDAGIQLIIGLAEGLINAIPILIEKAPEIIAKIVKALIENAPKILEAGVELIGMLAQGIWSALGKIGEVIGQIGQIIWDKLVECWNNLVFWLQDLGSSIWDTIVNIWNNIVLFFTEGIPNFINSIIQWFQELPYKIGYFIGEILGNIIQFGINVWNWVTTELPQIIQNIINWFAELPGNIWNWLCNVVSNIITWGQNMWNSAVTAVSNMINGIINWFAQLPGRIWTWLVNTINNVVNWGRDMANKGKEAAKDLFDNIINKIKELPEKVMEFGRNIVEGIWNGITGAGDWIKEKVGSFASGILDGMKNALGIHSPSTLFRDQVGKFIPQGIAIGIEADTDKAVKAIDGMNDDIMSEMNRAVNMETGSINAKASVKSNNSMLNVIQASFNIDGSVDIDGQKAGRILAPSITKTIKVGGLA